MLPSRLIRLLINTDLIISLLLSDFILTEKCGDLFSCPDTASLAHCVSADLAMGKGIAKLFKAKFCGVDDLKSQRTYKFFVTDTGKPSNKAIVGDRVICPC